ncbi:MAG: B12-binding domain-containing radical SAM protein [Vulcanimicrobiota bacterium]
MSFEIIQRKEDILAQENWLQKYPGGGSIRVCLIYPNTYSVAMSNLGFQTIYHHLATTSDIFVDRCYLPEQDLIKLYNGSKRKLFGWESERPLQEFHILAFSISYEMDYLNLLKILELANIPQKRKDRGENYPLIIAGGAAVSVNPEVISDFVDISVLGEGETPLNSIIEVIKNANNNIRKELLKELASIPGIYIPELVQIEYQPSGFIKKWRNYSKLEIPVKRQVNLRPATPAHSVVITPHTGFSSVFLVETSRGCPFSCNYCCVSLHNKPFRYYPVEKIKESIDAGLKITAKVGLLGAAVGSHPQLEEILDFIEEKHGQVSFSSLRADVLKPELLEKLHRLGQNLLTLAPETGSESLRKTLNKTLSDTRLMKTAENAMQTGFRDIRLYFMVGLPGETTEDIKANINMVREIQKIVQRTGGKVIVSVNQFIPKPGTALEKFPLVDESLVLEKIRFFKKPFYNDPSVVFKVESLTETLVQAFLARGNRNWGKYLLKYYKKSISNFASRIKKLVKKDKSVESLIFKKIENEISPWSIIS